jgi:hypothetical protein
MMGPLPSQLTLSPNWSDLPGHGNGEAYGALLPDSAVRHYPLQVVDSLLPYAGIWWADRDSLWFLTYGSPLNDVTLLLRRQGQTWRGLWVYSMDGVARKDTGQALLRPTQCPVDRVAA